MHRFAGTWLMISTKPLFQPTAFRRVVFVVACLSLGGCYYVKVGSGQLGVLIGRVPIDDVLAHGGLSPDERRRLALVPRVLTFARERMGLSTGGSYRTFYDTGSGPISWNVQACAKTSFKRHRWWFPLVGRLPYKGFFELENAHEEAEELKRRGLDVSVSEVPAYSTLGWFDDPVFRSMLHGSDLWLIETLLHELAHATVFREGDATFNESLATFVGERGALEMATALHGPGSRQVKGAEARQHDARLFSRVIGDLHRRLDLLYRSDRTRKEKLQRRSAIFEDARVGFAAYRRKRFLTAGYRWFQRAKLDNCMVLAYRTYHKDLDTFEDVHRLTGGGWQKTLAVFQAAADAEKPFTYLSDWRYRAWSRRFRVALRRGGD
ncbi:aminopeptidase [Planctomycetota bacterium]